MRSYILLLNISASVVRKHHFVCEAKTRLTIPLTTFRPTPGMDLYECDPDGDIIIQLPSGCPPFAIWDDGAEHTAVVEPAADEGHEPEPELAPANADDDENSGVGIRASSRHLILASAYFRRMLKGAWIESNTLQSEGYLRIEETDLDSSALRILMDIIHGRTRRVPKALSLEMLAKIAIIVDYYECHEVVEVFSRMWIKELKETVPGTYSRDTML
jgi:BTB/POZ domain